MREEPLISRLAIGIFAARSPDQRLATSLVGGRLKVGDDVLPVREPRTFDDCEKLARKHQLELHSLRWLDTLRRSRDSVTGTEEAWSSIFDAWADSEISQDLHSVAWSPSPLEQRSVAIALGGQNSAVALSMIPQHLEKLEATEVSSTPAARRLRLLQVRLGLQVRRGDDEQSLRDSAVRAALGAFHADGYAIADDLQQLVEVAARWESELLALGVPEDHEARTRIQSADFWIHAAAPDGRLVPMGGRLPGEVPGAHDPRMRYAVTGGQEGSPDSELSHIDPHGLVSLRSGWGETEKDVDGETHVTMILGPVRGREAHHDPSRITYHSQGRPWLIDPLDLEASGSDAHSVISVEDVRYRILGEAELVRHYADERVDGLVVKNTLYQRVQWQRHVVFARTANYLVVDDLVRSSKDYVAHQQWIVAPDVEIETNLRGFLLHADGLTVALVVSTTGLRDHTIDELVNSDGERIAWRIRVPMVGSSNRAVSIIADVHDPNVFLARRVARGGKEFTVDMVDKHLRETLVVTPELSSIVPPDLEPDEAVRRVIALAAAGDLSEDEALQQRLDVRRAIEDVKQQVWSEGGTREARVRGIDRLVQAGEDLRVTGLRDHGFASALIDIAGTDLADSIASNPLVGNVRRSPLLQWPGTELIQPGYGVPVLTTANTGTFPTDLQEPAVWSVDQGQLTLSSYLHDSPGDILTVYLHGATDRSRFALPRYERLRTMSQLGLGPVMLVSDPSLDLDARMMLSWFVGTEDVDIHREIARMVEAYARHRKIEKVLLVGNSGGGFGALQIGALLEGSRVVSFNPQIQIDRYVPRIAEMAHWALFGRETVSDDPVQAPRMDLIERYRRIDFAQDVVLIQNPGDDHHYKDHFLPFQEAFLASGNCERLEVQTPYLGPGHRVPPPHDYMDIVREAARRESDEWRLIGMRADRVGEVRRDAQRDPVDADRSLEGEDTGTP